MCSHMNVPMIPFLRLCNGTISVSVILKMSHIFNLPEKPVCKGTEWEVERKEKTGNVDFLLRE